MLIFSTINVNLILGFLSRVLSNQKMAVYFINLKIDKTLFNLIILIHRMYCLLPILILLICLVKNHLILSEVEGFLLEVHPTVQLIKSKYNNKISRDNYIINHNNYNQTQINLLLRQ